MIAPAKPSGADRQPDGSWTLIAPVFDHHRRRSGLWLEMACASDEQARAIAAILQERLQSKIPKWLFLFGTQECLHPYLPLNLSSDQILVYPVTEQSERPPTPDGLHLALRGSQRELAHATGADWWIVTDAAGSAGSTSSLADGLAGWQPCQSLVGLGWSAFLITGNQRSARKQPKADQIALTRLLGLVSSDADTDELESLFKTQPRLAFDLLNLVNSPALSLRTPATNFRHAITLLGRRQLQRWLQLLMFTRQTSHHEVNSLLWHSAFRGRLMELTAQHLDWSPTLSDQAFMVGVFSLIDVLLNDQLPNLLKPLALPAAIERALLEQQGPLGKLLCLVKAIERRDNVELRAWAKHFSLNALTLLELQLDSLFWVESFSSG
ncbi:EAL and HDOD domain-containing protein [Rhabdochromatium marinum]|uniref:EAL and HDOD domain-containing protein n=1 Tax=Rhabdochromatium marinum TaxID=48729 RepID=UPI0019057ECB|nr:HDOD domain-containing protein [Rhabdochromatium marinum]